MVCGENEKEVLLPVFDIAGQEEEQELKDAGAGDDHVVYRVWNHDGG